WIGLIAVATPPIIHLLTRRRYDVVDWAAMQFLQLSERTRRKIFLEELIIMLLRMGLIGLVDWASMQFLQLSERTRLKIFLEELILMLLRMGLIALFVLALAAPFLT